MSRWFQVVGLLALALLVALRVDALVAAAVAAAVGAACVAIVRRGGSAAPLVDAGDAAASSTIDTRTLRPLLDQVAEGILLLDDQDNVLVANAAAAAVFARPAAAMEGLSLIRATRDHAFVQALRDATGTPRELTLGDERVVEVTATLLDLGPVNAVLTIRDLTPLRRAERARADLVANVSHELRTPIAASRAIAETLEAGVDEPEQREHFLIQLTQELERLGAMVERLLRLSRLDSDTEEFTIEALDAGSLVAAALSRMQPVADRAGVRLGGDVALPRDSGLVRADSERVLEVLTNLLDNAIRYTPAGGDVTVTLQQDGPVVRCCVRDQGPGILPMERRRVFERFYTADRARGDAGAGLGLAIARNIVLRLGGQIWVADETPGATLCFTLPSAAPADAGGA